MEQIFIFSCVAGILAILYGFITARKVLSMPTGTKKMQEIASAIQEGASAYLKRQYLRNYATKLILEYPEFGPLWNSILENDLREEISDMELLGM